MRHTQTVPTLIASAALAVALAGLLGGGSTPIAASSLVAQIEPAAALGGGFTYQGSLSRAGRLVDGADACDMRFTLWNAASGGAQLGAAQTVAGVDFTQGLFTLVLNEAGQFGAAAFDGQARWLQVEAACPRGGAYTSLGRQALSAAPYASHSGSTSALQGRPVSAGAPSAGQVLAWNGSAWAPAADEVGVRYQRTVVVSPAALPAASGEALLAALSGIMDASAERPYLLKVEPGVYDLGDAALQMKPYVDIEGSGEGVTRITGRAKESFEASGTVRGANNAELRRLTVESVGGPGNYAVPIFVDGTSPRISFVTATGRDATQAYGIIVGNGAAPTLTHVTLRASGSTYVTGIYSYLDAAPALRSVTIVASGGGANAGVYNVIRSAPVLTDVTIIVDPGQGYSFGVWGEQSSAPLIYNSRIRATTALRSSSSTFRIAASQIDGEVRQGTGSIICVGAYNGAFAPLSGSCN